MKIASIKKCYFWLTLLIILECLFISFIGIWREYFWQSVVSHDYLKFSLYLGYFSIAALLACLVNGYSQFIQNYLSLILRHRLTKKAFKMSQDMSLECRKIENLEQRIQDDCFSYNTLKIGLLVGGIRNTMVFLVYSSILIYQLSLGYLILPILYAIIGTIIAMRIARPLINLNYINQNFEATFRRFLTRLNYAKVHRNNYNLFKTTKYLAYFQSFYSQITIIVPYLLLAPAYFSLKITFGVLMQCSSSINQIIDCLSYGIQSFNDFNKFLSCRKRLIEIGVL